MQIVTTELFGKIPGKDLNIKEVETQQWLSRNNVYAMSSRKWGFKKRESLLQFDSGGLGKALSM